MGRGGAQNLFPNYASGDKKIKRTENNVCYTPNGEPFQPFLRAKREF
jgi:hypothetical protein